MILCLHVAVQAQADIRYDPWDWVTYRNSRFVTSVAEGSEYIYFGTNGGILRRHIFGKYWDYPITRSQGLPEDEIDAVYYDFRTHVLWASSSSGLSHSVEGGVRWEMVSNEILGLRPGERIARIGSTADFLWCETASQVLKLDHLSGFLVIPYADLPESDVRWGSALLTGSRKRHGILNNFTATGGWINDLDMLRGPRLEEFHISTIYTDRFQDIWLGTWGGSVFHGDFQMKLLEPIPFGPAQTSAEILLRMDNGMWSAGIDPSTLYSGITLYDPQRGIWDIFRVGFEITFGEDQVYYGAQVNEEWWFGTPDGIQVYMPAKDSWLPISQSRDLPDSRVVSLAFDGEYVYGGTLTGLVRISPSSRTRVSWSVSEMVGFRPVYVVHWDGESLWIATDVDLWQWGEKRDELRRFGIPGGESLSDVTNRESDQPVIVRPVTAIASSDSMVYFGDEFGVLCYDRNVGEWRRITGRSRLTGFEILSLTLSQGPEENEGMLWIGTSDGTLALDLTDDFIWHFKKKDGLPSDIVRSSLIQGDIAWFGTPEGMVRFEWKKHLR
ncbi:MAG: hypothetical protein V3U24_06865 [Candidatus Neomarinimicrobiota bacterium]